MNPDQQKPLNPQPPVVQPTELKRLSDAEAQSLLTINKLETKSANKSSKKFLVLVVLIIAVTLGLIFYLESRNHASTNSSSGSTKNPFTSSNGGTVNSDTKYCSNPVNALTTC